MKRRIQVGLSDEVRMLRMYREISEEDFNEAIQSLDRRRMPVPEIADLVLGSIERQLEVMEEEFTNPRTGRVDRKQLLGNDDYKELVELRDYLETEAG
jgi:hypothetical protein